MLAKLFDKADQIRHRRRRRRRRRRPDAPCDAFQISFSEVWRKLQLILGLASCLSIYHTGETERERERERREKERRRRRQKARQTEEAAERKNVQKH